MTKVVKAISISDGSDDQVGTGNRPAEVKLVNEMRMATEIGMPPFTAKMPKVKATGK